MQSFGALALVAVLAATGSVPHHRMAAAAPDAAEVYVAELDADWNVAREVRMPCDVERGCAVDLALSDADAGQLHVRFDALRRGRVDVASRIDDKAGHALVQPPLTLALDGTGFGATHVGSDETKASTSGNRRIFMLAVRVPGFVAPAPHGLPAAGEAI